MRLAWSCLTAFVLAVATVFAWPSTARAQTPPPIERFIYADPSSTPERSIPVWTWAPADAPPDTPIVIVVHGIRRNAREYLEMWRPLAERYRVIVAAPEFPRSAFPARMGWATGSMRDGRGHRVAPGADTFSMVDHLFDALRARYANTTPRYWLFGHSAGGQFVHRMLIHCPERIELAVAANPGWYPELDWGLAWPHGLRSSGVDAQALGRAFSTPMVLLLGAKDNAPDGEERARPRVRQAARRTRPHTRAQVYLERARTLARAMDLPLRWSSQVVPRVGHQREPMSAAAAQLMFSDRRTP